MSVTEPSAEDYDAVVFPGGHGTVWDVNQDRHARTLLREAVAGEDGVALVVCHAVGILAFTRDDDGEFLVDGRGSKTRCAPPAASGTPNWTPRRA